MVSGELMLGIVVLTEAVSSVPIGAVVDDVPLAALGGSVVMFSVAD